MTHQLPNELKIQIIQHVDRKSLPAVLRVNSTFHDIGEPLLYHTIILKPFPSKSQLLGTATQCLNTVIRRPAVAAAVHSIGLNLFDWRPYVRHSESAFGAEEFFEAFRTALPKVLNLANLEISKWGNTAEDTIEQLPRGCRFPNLQHYYGPPEVLDDIQSIALKTLHIRSTGSSITPVTRAYSAAARLSGQTLRVLDVLLEGLDGHPDHGEWEGVIVEIPSLFPNLRRLSLELEPTISFAILDKLIPNIARLPNLRLLGVSSWAGVPIPTQELHVKHLHTGCPQLRAIVLSNDPWTFCERSQAWVAPPEAGYQIDERHSEEANWRKYLEDPDHEGFVYPSLIYGK